MSLTNITIGSEDSDYGSAPAWVLPGWAEPIMVASILIISMFLTRRKNYSIFSRRRKEYNSLLDSDPEEEIESARSSDDLLAHDYMVTHGGSDDDASFDSLCSTSKNPPKKRDCFGMTLYTPNTSRFADHYHSRILQKFPFLMEMFYWIITFAFYRLSKISSNALFPDTIWDVAQGHALSILEFEEFSMFRFLWPVAEVDVQRWFLGGHQTLLTVLNRSYALIHIPGTVCFIAWYYYKAPSFNTFSIVRRTLTLTNFLAFSIFIVYPCMPPRLLPEEYGFLDTVGHNKGQSVFMKGNFVNSLAAMPSMHFGYAFCIGVTLVHHSGLFRRTLEPGEMRKSRFWQLWYLLLGIAYPAFILVVIVATANHYYMDACMAFLVACLAYCCNKVFLVFLPLEDLLLWCLRLEKPVPTTANGGKRSLSGER